MGVTQVAAMGSIGKIHSLQVLRAVAALSVAWAHSEGIFEAVTRTPLRPAHHVGTVGVDIFFVVSGFIIARAAAHAPSGWTFFVRRWQRVAPLYYVATLPWLILAVVAGTAFASPLFVTVTFWPFSPAGMTWPLLPSGWTLCYEMLFYSVVALLVGRSRLAVIAVLAVYVGFLALQSTGAGGVFNFLGNPILLEFLIGAGLARMQRPVRPVLGVVVIAASLALLAYWTWFGLGWVHDGRFAFNGSISWPRLIMFGVPAAGIVIGALALEPWAKGPLVRAAAYLGDASYSIYLVHVFALERMLTVWRLLDWPAALVVPFGLILSAVLGVAAYEVVERPLLPALRSRRLETAPAQAN